jgi:hypothetical protein
MPTATLPELPKGREFEELVAAVFQSSGMFVERDLTEREEVEVLQLDAISTDYRERPPVLHLVEAKSGKWGFKDIFKIKGWMTYLNIPRACLITTEPRERPEAYRRLAAKIGVNLVVVEDVKNCREALGPLVGPGSVDDVDVWSWRFWHWAERRMIERLRAQHRGQPEVRRFDAILDHAFRINSGVFFTETIAERVEALYATYSDYRNLAGRCGQEMSGGAFDNPDARIPEPLFNATFYDCALNEIQVATFMEHKARLTLLKAAVDYLSYKSDGQVNKAEKTVTWKLDGKDYVMSLASFPDRFEQALAELGTEPHFRRYPIFWQWFLGVFGGFILKDYQDRDYARLAEKSGIPVEALPQAFAAFDKLFPVDGGWFRDDPNSNVRVLVLYPVPLRGVGANYRRALYTKDRKFEQLDVTKIHTRKDLSKWNNAVVELLTA